MQRTSPIEFERETLPCFSSVSNSAFTTFNISGNKRRGLLYIGGPLLWMWWRTECLGLEFGWKGVVKEGNILSNASKRFLLKFLKQDLALNNCTVGGSSSISTDSFMILFTVERWKGLTLFDECVCCKGACNKRLLAESTYKERWDRKSAPSIVWCKDLKTANFQEKCLEKPRSKTKYT